MKRIILLAVVLGLLGAARVLHPKNSPTPTPTQVKENYRTQEALGAPMKENQPLGWKSPAER